MRSSSVEALGAGSACQSQGKDRRLAWVDMLRGAALLGMVVYHAAWDLHAYGFLTQDPSAAPAWLAFGRTVAGIFLGLSGFGLALAQRRSAASRAEVKRLIRLAGAAALVSAVTWMVVPAAPVWFGILHCIVVTNIVALALRPLPGPMLVACAIAAPCAPFVLPIDLGIHWAWTGLSATEPRTLDFRPVLPWLSVVLAGLVLGRTSLGIWQGGSERGLFHWLGLAGRHSLAIYLIHQPVMIGALMVAYGPMPEPPTLPMVLRDPAEGAAFSSRCRSACRDNGGEPALCTATCHCALTAMLDQASPAPTPEAALRRCAPVSGKP